MTKIFMIKHDKIADWYLWISKLGGPFKHDAEATLKAENCLSETWGHFSISGTHYAVCCSEYDGEPQKGEDVELNIHHRKMMDECFDGGPTIFIDAGLRRPE